MSAGFTPGPWIFHEPFAGFSKITDAADNLIFGIARGFDDEAQTDEICEANARLIAAAPELYAACEGLLEYVQRFCSESSPTDAACDFAIRALAKARGEQ